MSSMLIAGAIIFALFMVMTVITEVEELQPIYIGIGVTALIFSILLHVYYGPDEGLTHEEVTKEEQK